MLCEKCQFTYDKEDAFCRKCGTALAYEGDFNEVAGAASEASLSDQPAIEVAEASVETNLAITTTDANLPMLVEKKTGLLAKTVGVLSSPVGRKIVRSAALVAVGVGLELVAQASSRQQQDQKLSRRKPGQPLNNNNSKRGFLVAQVLRRSANGSESVTQFFAPPSGTTVTETFIYDDVTVRRITKW